MKGRQMKKTRFISILLTTLISLAYADLTLTVNGLDTSMPVEVEPGNKIIIAVAGRADEQKESYSVTCDVGGKLTPLSEPNTSAEQQNTEQYLFTFEDEIPALPVINLTVAGKLDYQLVFFIIPGVNVTVFGIDSDSLDYVPQQPIQQQELVVSQAVLPSRGGGGMFYTMGVIDCNEVLDPNFFPNLNNDSFVNFVDFAIFAENWLASGTSLLGDFDNSETVDSNDLEYLSYFWLASACSPSPEDVFDAFKNALTVGDINKALTFIAQALRDEYAQIFQIIELNLPEYVAGMGELIFESQDEGTAKYEMIHQAGPETYLFPVIFIKNDRGIWQIYKF
jgi:hypothetical protein